MTPCTPSRSRATRSTRSRVRATKATRAPRACSSRTRARPSPEVPPVIATRNPGNGFDPVVRWKNTVPSWLLQQLSSIVPLPRAGREGRGELPRRLHTTSSS